jgi:hypothetical protein
MKSKKGIEALASTVLLICFAAVLGLIIMSWGTNIIGNSPNQCSKVTLSVVKEGNSINVIPKINDVLCNDKKIDVSGIIK